ncbi:SLC13 family permease [Saccharothrix variisporea]|uniref:SLC13 family permease n=1 Tax=Saccharothrix variisporea TaxID=543527 RepID=UPI001FE3C549|nr:SLC13 family permease [Saccharothrix variisporea]
MRRLEALDWLALGLLAAGGLCVAVGWLPADAAGAVLGRVLPLLVFLAAVIVLAELTARAEVFDVLAVHLARLARGRYAVLFLLCVLFASLTTAVLNLDTTAVLLTPVMLATARKLDLEVVPFAMTTVWLANTASLLLPASNLTNLLAMDRLGLTPGEFGQVMLWPQVASVAATAVCLWLLYWRSASPAGGRFPLPAAHRPSDPFLFYTALIAVVLFVVGVLVGIPLEIAALACAVVLVAAFALRSRRHLRVHLIPWRLLVLVPGLFLVMGALGAQGLTQLVHGLVNSGQGLSGLLHAAATGAGLSNAINNLPAYVTGEAAVPADDRTRLLAVLIGTNAGPIITPWASLATLLWYERCQSAGVTVSLRKLVSHGAIAAVAATTAAVLALSLAN